MSPTSSVRYFGRLSGYFAKRPASGQVLLWLLRGCLRRHLHRHRHAGLPPFQRADARRHGQRLHRFLLHSRRLPADRRLRRADPQQANHHPVGRLFRPAAGAAAGQYSLHGPGAVHLRLGDRPARAGAGSQLVVHPADKDGTVHVDVSQAGSGGTTTVEQRSSTNARPCLLIITVICCYVAISTLLQTKDEFRFIIPYVEFSKQVKGGQAAGAGHQCDYRRPNCRYL